MSAPAPDSTSGQNAPNAGLKPLDTQGAAVEAGPALTVDSAANVGIFLADKTGRPLYMYTADKPGESVCYEGCAQRWPPVLALQGTPSAGAAQVDASKLGTIQRRDGNAQVTYAGHPLYYYQRDQGSAGQPQGNDVKDSAGEWYLVSPAGEKASH